MDAVQLDPARPGAWCALLEHVAEHSGGAEHAKARSTLYRRAQKMLPVSADTRDDKDLLQVYLIYATEMKKTVAAAEQTRGCYISIKVGGSLLHFLRSTYHHQPHATPLSVISPSLPSPPPPATRTAPRPSLLAPTLTPTLTLTLAGSDLSHRREQRRALPSLGELRA